MSFFWALGACLLSLGTVLTPWFTLSPRASVPEVSRLDECLFSGPDWKCETQRKETPVMDSGATSWQEIPAHYFFNKHLQSEKPFWNPYIGSGYPIFLDGITRFESPTRFFLNHFPGDGARDLLIFFRYVLIAWGVLFALMQLGVRGLYLLPFGMAATMLPMVARFVDIVFLDVDMMTSWIFALSVPWVRGQKLSKLHWLGFAILGLWIGLQAFVQSQVVFGVAIGLVCVILVRVSGGQSLAALALFSVPFLAASLPAVLSFKSFFGDLMSTRSFLTCPTANGMPLATLWSDGWVGYLKNSELETVYALLGLPLIGWISIRQRAIRSFALVYVVLFLWLWLGAPRWVCHIDGLSGIHVARHLVSHLQALYLILAATSLYLVVQKMKFRKTALFFGFVFLIYPALNRDLITYRHLKGQYTQRVHFSPEPIPESNVYSAVQKLSKGQDRRHFSPDGRLYPNYSALFEILDLRVLYGLYPRRMYQLNDGLFRDWEGMPDYGHPDRFVGSNFKSGKLTSDFEKLLLLHRVSLLTFSKKKNWIDSGEIYNPVHCQKVREDVLAVFYLCPQIGGLGYFPRLVMTGLKVEESLEILKNQSVHALVDFAVIEAEGPSEAASGRIVSHSREPNRLVYELDVKQAGFFVVADSYFPGWKAFVNQQPTEIFPANVAFKAVRVPTGTVSLEFKYSPKRDSAPISRQ